MAKVRLVLALFVVFSVFGGLVRPAGPVFAQAGDAVSLGSVPIAFGMPWDDVTDDGNEGDGIVVLEADDDWHLVFAEPETNATVEDVVERSLLGFVTESAVGEIVVADSDTESYALGTFGAAVEFAYFAIVPADAASVTQVITAPKADLAEAIASAQDEVTVDDEAVFRGVEGEGLLPALDVDAPAASGNDESPQRTPTEAPQVATDPRDAYTWVDARDLVIRPDDYIGEQVAISGEVFNIFVDGDVTGMQIWVNGADYEAVMVAYEGDSRGIYEGTWVTVYGIGAGSIEGTNAFGGSVSQPLVFAQIVDF